MDGKGKTALRSVLDQTTYDKVRAILKTIWMALLLIFNVRYLT